MVNVTGDYIAATDAAMVTVRSNYLGIFRAALFFLAQHRPMAGVAENG